MRHIIPNLTLDSIGKPYTLDDVAVLIKFSYKPSSLKHYTEAIIIELQKSNRHKYASSYNDALNAILKFNKKQDLDLKDITPKFIEEFKSHLLSKGRKINTIGVYLRNFKAIYNRAIKEGYVPEKFYPFKNIKIKYEQTKKRAIGIDVIRKIRDLDLEKWPNRKLARDIFMFSFYNRGINFIDIFYLKEKDIVDDRIYYRRRKVKGLLNVKISPETREIINRYIKNEGPEEYIFPMLKKGDEVQSYKTNFRNISKYLEKIGEEVGKDMGKKIPLTSYIARHSWATIAKRKGISTALISEGLGHSTEKITQVYLDSFEDEELDAANETITKLD